MIVPCMVNSWLYCSFDKKLQTRRGQFGAHQQRHQAADEEHAEAGNDVHDADHLVIGGGDQLVDEGALRARPGRVRAARRQRRDRGCFSSHGVAGRPITGGS